MARRILVIDGHPDKDRGRFCHALAQAYVDGALEAGKETRLITLADADFPLLRSNADFGKPPEAPAILAARDDIRWADHLVFVFPLWVGSAPALVRAFLEQTARAGFFAGTGAHGFRPQMKGKSARLIMTMGMPAFFYRTVFGAHGLKSVAQNLSFTGVRPVRMALFGGIEGGESVCKKALAKVRALGSRAM